MPQHSPSSSHISFKKAIHSSRPVVVLACSLSIDAYISIRELMKPRMLATLCERESICRVFTSFTVVHTSDKKLTSVSNRCLTRTSAEACIYYIRRQAAGHVRTSFVWCPMVRLSVCIVRLMQSFCPTIDMIRNLTNRRVTLPRVIRLIHAGASNNK